MNSARAPYISDYSKFAVEIFVRLRCPISGDERTQRGHSESGAIDPHRTRRGTRRTCEVVLDIGVFSTGLWTASTLSRRNRNRIPERTAGRERIDVLHL